LTVLRSNLFIVIPEACFIQSENIWIPNKNKANHHNKSHQEKTISSICTTKQYKYTKKYIHTGKKMQIF
jgi:hypothetical protein